MTVPDWLTEIHPQTELVRIHGIGKRTSFVHTNRDGRRLSLAYYWHDRSRRMYGEITFGPDTEGPPGCGHGGSIAAVLDDAMGTAVWCAGHRVVAVNLNVDFRRFVPLDAPPRRVEVRIVRRLRRKVYTRAWLRGPDGTLHAEGKGIFLQIDFERLLGQKSSGPVA